MGVSPYINFAGNCREAVGLYARVFGSPEPEIMSFGEAPPDTLMTLTAEATQPAGPAQGAGDASDIVIQPAAQAIVGGKGHAPGQLAFDGLLGVQCRGGGLAGRGRIRCD